MALYQMPRPMPPIAGPTIQQTYVFQPNQPDHARYSAKRGNTTQVAPPVRVEGATVQPWFIYPTNQPDQARYAARWGLRTQVAPPVRLEGATVQPWFIYPTNQPEMSRFVARQALRYLVNVRSREHESLAVQAQTYLFPLSQPERKYYVRNTFSDVELPFDGLPSLQSYIFAVGQPQSRRQFQIPRAKAPIDVAAAVIQSDVFRHPQPDLARYAGLHAPRYRIDIPDYAEGATVQPSFVFQPNQPELIRFSQRHTPRFTVDAPKRIDDGAAVVTPQTYIFPVSQPELRAWLKFDPNRVPDGSTPQVDGATVQATYVFPLLQPERKYYVRNTFAETKTPILGVTVVAAQTYEFAVSQPEARRYNLPDVNRVAPTGPTKQVSGSTLQQTYVFVPNQPELRAYSLLQRSRGLGGTVAWPLDTFRPSGPTGTADYIVLLPADDYTVLLPEDDL
jgi:hypothetical protein